MNINKLKEAEQNFLARYPGGFSNPEMLEIGKKHKMEKMVDFAQTSFTKESFENPEEVAGNMIKIVSRSSMVSLFEKPKFRDYVRAMSISQKIELASALENLLHTNEEEGFSRLVGILQDAGIAKWPLVTVYGAYFNPTKDVFIKPTTAKNVIKYFELEDIEYNSKPTFAFYKKYREYINSMKKSTDKSLSGSNAAFCGFLMMSS
ncbi:hypothetical protein ACFLZV_00530 [Candidatus Margulisiibacteriota bacterium]